MKTETFTFNNTTYTIIIGKNAYENTEIVKNAQEHDIWFHVENSPSCHVLLKRIDNLKVPIQVIKRCAYLCKINSNAKYERISQIIYTHACNVVPGDIPGKVYSSQCKILRL